MKALTMLFSLAGLLMIAALLVLPDIPYAEEFLLDEIRGVNIRLNTAIVEMQVRINGLIAEDDAERGTVSLNQHRTIYHASALILLVLGSLVSLLINIVLGRLLWTGIRHTYTHLAIDDALRSMESADTVKAPIPPWDLPRYPRQR